MDHRRESKQQRALTELQNAFAEIDTDGDGRITPEELRKALTSMTGQDTSLKLAKEMVAELDKDGNGSVEFDEFCAQRLSKQASDTNLAAMKQTFSDFDRNGDGYISPKGRHSPFPTKYIYLSGGELNKFISFAKNCTR